MPLNIPNSARTQVENSFKQLASAAQALNSASEDLGKVIRLLDASLKKLSLGITAWVQVNGTSDETQYWTNELGYAKVDGKWGVALREVTGYLLDNNDESEEIWSFNDAPRALRTEAVDKIPDLIMKLLQLTEEATKNLQGKAEQAAELTFLVSNLIPNAPLVTPQQWQRPARSASADESDKEGSGASTSAPATTSAPAAASATPPAPVPVSPPTPRTLPAERAQ